MALQDRWYMQGREAQGEAWRRHRPCEWVVRLVLRRFGIWVGLARWERVVIGCRVI